MTVTLKLEESRSEVVLEGDIGIAEAAELKRVLMEALEACNRIEVSLGKATELDVTAVQLLWAAHREAGQANLEFAYVGTEPEQIVAALAEAGLELVSPGAGPR